MEKKKGYIGLKWEMTLAIVPAAAVGAAIVFVIMCLSIKSSIAGEVASSQNIVGYVAADTVNKALDSIWLYPIVGTIVIAVFIAVLCLAIIGGQMNKLKCTRETLSAIINGDFTVEIPKHKEMLSNEITQIDDDLNRFVAKMDKLLKTIDITTGKLSHHSEYFSAMAEELNEDTGVQSEALNELTETMRGFSESITTLAENATELGSFAEKTFEDGKVANSRMAEMVRVSEQAGSDMQVINSSMQQVDSSMEELTSLVLDVSNAAKEINSITGVIKGIATQTNLLSLNASIEAARAGESGKGFAVVAEEIKTLADTSGQNAVAIENLIDNISDLVTKTEKSTHQSQSDIRSSFELLSGAIGTFATIKSTADSTGEVLSQLISEITKVNDIAVDLAAVSQEQAANCENVLEHTVNADKISERTREKSDSLKKGTEALHLASADLNNEMHYFKI